VYFAAGDGKEEGISILGALGIRSSSHFSRCGETTPSSSPANAPAPFELPRLIIKGFPSCRSLPSWLGIRNRNARPLSSRYAWWRVPRYSRDLLPKAPTSGGGTPEQFAPHNLGDQIRKPDICAPGPEVDNLFLRNREEMLSDDAAKPGCVRRTRPTKGFPSKNALLSFSKARNASRSRLAGPRTSKRL